jgi:preprotein translocase subunit SecY
VPLIPSPTVFTITTMVITMTAGTAVIMWLGELITDRGVGNGMSLMIFTQVIAVIPGEMLAIYRTKKAFVFLLVLAVGVAIIAFVAFMEQAQRRIPVQYAKRMVGRKMYGGSSTYIPLKVNQAGVIPVIFASSMLYIPQLAAQLFGSSSHPQAWVQWVSAHLVVGNSPDYMLLFFLLIVFFTYFYVSITFDPVEVADNMKKYGGFIPGIRPGRATAEYIDKVLTRLTFGGALYISAVCVLPTFMTEKFKVPFYFGGTSLLIVVGVALDTVQQIESHLITRNYEGFTGPKGPRVRGRAVRQRA